MKSLLLVLPATLLFSVSTLAAGSIHGRGISSGRSVSQDAREAWFRSSIGDILEGRVAVPARREGRTTPQR